MHFAAFTKDTAQSVNNIIDELNKFTRQLNDLRDEPNDFTRYVNDLTGELKDLTRYVNDITGELNDLTRYVNDFTDELNEFMRQLNDFTDELNEVTRQLNDFSRQLNDLRDELAKITGYFFYLRHIFLIKAVEQARKACISFPYALLGEEHNLTSICISPSPCKGEGRGEVTKKGGHLSASPSTILILRLLVIFKLPHLPTASSPYNGEEPNWTGLVFALVFPFSCFQEKVPAGRMR